MRKIPNNFGEVASAPYKSSSGSFLFASPFYCPKFFFPFPFPAEHYLSSSCPCSKISQVK